MVAAYSMDKVLATFLGRPPLISWRYCDIQMPLDLSVEEIFADSAVRNAAIARLDEETGWNLESSLMKGTCPRIALITSVFREKVLELSLGRQFDNLSQRVEYADSSISATSGILLTFSGTFHANLANYDRGCQNSSIGNLILMGQLFPE